MWEASLTQLLKEHGSKPYHSQDLLASRRLLLKILEMCEKHRDLVETTFRYVSERKEKLFSKKLIMSRSPKCSNAKRQEK